MRIELLGVLLDHEVVEAALVFLARAELRQHEGRRGRQLVLIIAGRHENHVDHARAQRLDLLKAGDDLGTADIVDARLAAELAVDLLHPDVRHGEHGVVLRDERDGTQRLGITCGGKGDDACGGQRSDQQQVSHGDPPRPARQRCALWSLGTRKA